MGMVYYLLPEQLSQAARLVEQGPDVLDEPLSLQAFADRLKPYRGEIKGVLTRGGAVSGIGNAYADEVLFAAGIYPFKKRTSLSPDELAALHDAVYRVPAEAVPLLRERMGDTIHRKVRDHLKVHGRGNEACPACNSKLTHITSNGHRTDYCRAVPAGELAGAAVTGEGRYATASTSTSAESPLTSVAARATFKSYICCRFIQNSGVMPRTRPTRSAVSAVIPRRQWTISFTRTAGTPIALARRYWEIPSSSKISAKCSPGWIGSTSTAALLSGSPLSLSLQRLAQSKQSRRAIGH